MTMVGFLVTLMKAATVFGLLALTVKMLRRYDRRSGTSGRRAPGARGGRGRGRRSRRVLDVVERAPLGRSASMVLVRVQDQHWVVGVTEQQVTMLLEVDLPDDDPGTIDLRPRRGAAASGGAPAPALSFGELLKQARQYLPVRGRIEPLDPSEVQGEVATAGADAPAARPDEPAHATVLAGSAGSAGSADGGDRRTDAVEHLAHSNGSEDRTA